jgi:FlaA1/EpsC-like NDP-sugar epimerase
LGGDETMMVDSMDAARVIDYFKGKCILITGSTGFLGKSMCSFYIYIDVYCIFADVVDI